MSTELLFCLKPHRVAIWCKALDTPKPTRYECVAVVRTVPLKAIILSKYSKHFRPLIGQGVEDIFYGVKKGRDNCGLLD